MKWLPIRAAIIAAVAALVVALASAQALPTTRVSVSSEGLEGNGRSFEPAISGDGRFVAFQSWASNLVEGDTNVCRVFPTFDTGNCPDIFVHDRETGTTERVNVSSAGEQANSWSYNPDVSGDGRFVSFVSGASNLVEDDTNVSFYPDGMPYPMEDVFVRDRETGRTARVSVGSDGAQANGPSDRAAISDDGRYVAFLSTADNLVSGDTNGQRDVFRHDLQTGETLRVNVNSAGVEANGWSYHVTISADGRFVGFSSSASNLVAPPEAEMDIDAFLWDAESGRVELISAPSGTEPAGPYGEAPFVSADGRWAVFSSGNPNLVPSADMIEDVFLRDRLTGETRRISLTMDGREAGSASFVMGLTSDGRFAVYRTASPAIVPGDTNDREDVFVWDRLTGQTVRASVDSAGREANGHSEMAEISDDGRIVAFQSDATNLVPADTNGATDVFAREIVVSPAPSPTPTAVATPTAPPATPVAPPPTGDGPGAAETPFNRLGQGLVALVAAWLLVTAVGATLSRRHRPR
ncbi:MAG: hypothetical protein QME71_07780 [Dehalococcoidia bacterium]|nr:hypothetical protein [Dehalococcoidia bacterium]